MMDAEGQENEQVSRSYEAILHGDRVEWMETPPEAPDAVRVQVTILEETPPQHTPAERRKAMADALRKIAAMGGIPGIPDPVAWQREIREDRPLPGREE